MHSHKCTPRCICVYVCAYVYVPWLKISVRCNSRATN